MLTRLFRNEDAAQGYANLRLSKPGAPQNFRIRPVVIVDGAELSMNDVGRMVAYLPAHVHGSMDHPDVELGYLVDWNEQFIFVRYNDSPTCAKATRPQDLRWPNT